MDTVGRIVNLGNDNRAPSLGHHGVASSMPLQEFQAVVASNEKLRALLGRCREKLKAYYEDTRGEYPGGPLYGDLMRAIDEALDGNKRLTIAEKPK